MKISQRRRARLFNILAALCLCLTVVSCGWVVSVAVNPYGWFNPFPPARQITQPTPVAKVETREPTPEPVKPTPTEAATATSVPVTPEVTPEVEPTRANTPTPEPSPVFSLTVTPAPSPTRSPFTFTAIITMQVHPVQLCDWMGVAGTVTDLQGKPVLGAFVHVWGPGNLDQVIAVGANPVYGPSGWEVRLARAQVVGNWQIQLVTSPDATRSAPLSEVYTLSMPGDCKRNLARVSFQQNH